jgi:hypothetical protein
MAKTALSFMSGGMFELSNPMLALSIGRLEGGVHRVPK